MKEYILSIASIFGVIIIAGIAFFKGKSQGNKEAQNANNEKLLNQINNVNKERAKISTDSDNDVRKWMSDHARDR